MKKSFIFSLSFLFSIILCQAQNIRPFQKGDRVAFLGNSITDGGHYHSYIWLYYMTRFPNERIDIFNAGIGGDVAQQMYDRLNDDVFPHKPTVIVLTFGMNDTGYFEFFRSDADEVAERKIKTSDSSYQLIEKKFKDYPAIRKILMSSPPFDETAKIKSAVYPKKNAAMLKIADIMQASAKKNNWDYLDINRPMTTINQQQQKQDSTFTFEGADRVHPTNDGHLLMGSLFLKAQGFAGREVANVQIDAAEKKIKENKYCEITNLTSSKTGARFDYLAESLPFPIDTVSHGSWGDTRKQSDALKIIPFIDEFDKEMLEVNGLDNGQYVLKIDGNEIGQWSAQELANGINLATKTNTPEYQQAREIMYLNEERWEIERRLRVYYWYQFDVFKAKGLLFADNQQAIDTLEQESKTNIFAAGQKQGYLQAMHPEIRDTWRKEMKLLVDEIYTINKPKKHSITIESLK